MKCGEKCVSHIETDAEKQCSGKIQLFSQAVLWHPKNCPAHIKTKKPKDHRKNRITAKTYNLQFQFHTKRYKLW
jgi:hypothetical protein